MSESETPGPEPAHDVLAAEAFGFPAADPELHHHGPVVLPEDPTGSVEPHDVLAAEEFPMPAPRPGLGAALARTGQASPWQIAVAGVAGFIAAIVLLRFVRRA